MRWIPDFRNRRVAAMFLGSVLNFPSCCIRETRNSGTLRNSAISGSRKLPATETSPLACGFVLCDIHSRQSPLGYYREVVEGRRRGLDCDFDGLVRRWGLAVSTPELARAYPTPSSVFAVKAASYAIPISTLGTVEELLRDESVAWAGYVDVIESYYEYRIGLLQQPRKDILEVFNGLDFYFGCRGMDKLIFPDTAPVTLRTGLLSGTVYVPDVSDGGVQAELRLA